MYDVEIPRAGENPSDHDRVQVGSDRLPALIPDELSFLIPAHLPVNPPCPEGGRARVGDRTNKIDA